MEQQSYIIQLQERERNIRVVERGLARPKLVIDVGGPIDVEGVRAKIVAILSEHGATIARNSGLLITFSSAPEAAQQIERELKDLPVSFGAVEQHGKYVFRPLSSERVQEAHREAMSRRWVQGSGFRQTGRNCIS